MLYIVATPIGNLGEITYRAVETLKSVDAVLCEDTRRTSVLLAHYGIKTRVESYHKFSEREKAAAVADRLERGENLALVSDAGMPIVSDPGSVLVCELVARGLEFTVISGPCAAIDALVLSGLDASSFCMCGFLPDKNKDRREFIERFRMIPATLIFYSPPHDVRRDLGFLFEELGGREVAVVREISKLHESVVRGRLGENLDFPERGEFVIVVAGAEKREDYSQLSAAEHVRILMGGGLSAMDAVKRAAAERGVPKAAVYKEYQNYLDREKRQ